MKFADFFIGSRQLFGFLVPGAIWLFCLVIPLAGTHVSLVLRQAGLIDMLLFLVAALIIGTAMESLSFKLAVCVSAALFRERVSREKHDTDYFPVSIAQTLITTARCVAQQHEPTPGYILSLSNREFSQYCKQIVFERSNYYKRRLEEYEAEINLLAMLPLPLLALAIVTAISGLGGLHLPVQGTWTVSRFGMPSLCAAVTLLLLLRLHPLRREEAEWWFRFFVMQYAGVPLDKSESSKLAVTTA